MFSYTIKINFCYHLLVFMSLYFLLKENSSTEKTIVGKFSKTNKIIVMLILGVIALYLWLYVLAAYLFAGAALFYIGLDKLKFNKDDLKRENYKIDCEVLPNLFELKYYHILFMIVTLIVAFLFNVLIGSFYLIFIVLGSVSAFFKLNIYNAIPQRLYFYSKGFRKDSNTIKYHWATNFFFFKVLNRLTIISLPLGLLIIALVLPFHQKNDLVLLFNLSEMAIICCIIFIGSFQTDLYIIFFGNSSVLYKFGYFCYRCAFYGTFGLGGGFIIEKQFIHNSFDSIGFRWEPTFFTNVPNICVGQPWYLDADQYWQHHMIQKYLPEITPEQYMVKHRNIVSQINSTKANQILKANWSTLAENATKDELTKIRLGEAYFYGGVSRK